MLFISPLCQVGLAWICMSYKHKVHHSSKNCTNETEVSRWGYCSKECFLVVKLISTTLAAFPLLSTHIKLISHKVHVQFCKLIWGKNVLSGQHVPFHCLTLRDTEFCELVITESFTPQRLLYSIYMDDKLQVLFSRKKRIFQAFSKTITSFAILSHVKVPLVIGTGDAPCPVVIPARVIPGSVSTNLTCPSVIVNEVVNFTIVLCKLWAIPITVKLCLRWPIVKCPTTSNFKCT